MKNIFSGRFGGVAIFYLLFLAITTLTRLALLVQALPALDTAPVKLLGLFGWGLLFDLAAASYASLPLMLALWLAPKRWLASRWHRFATGSFFAVALYVLLFGAVAEWFFWDEFASRFNFIAVDYLIYTTEVIGNIRESYPLPLVFGGLALITALGWLAWWKTGLLQTWLASAPENSSRNPGMAWLALPLVFHFSLSNDMAPEFGNAYNQELARNGLFSFFAAYRNNSLDYDRFYPVLPVGEAFARMKPLLNRSGASAFRSDEPTDIARRVEATAPEEKWNVIQITVESLSAKFLGAFGNRDHLTPNLDRLCAESLVFTNLYATGTRTVRGMEALALSVPPTPGQSIVRRLHNEHLFSLGSIFQARGYDTAFIYSGFGYFDNMNAFFAANGYRVIDRASVRREDITHANVWGACDEDLYRWTLREADAAFAAGKPFHHFVMTTSNHRPYSFPEGKIDLPPGNRSGAVKYTDYAIGQFLIAARERPWFTNTLFVIVGDHCASAAGKTALPIGGYHVPAIIWNPLLIRPQQMGTLCSQIDLPPTVLGLMNWDYESSFYGDDIRQIPSDQGRAFISTYQRLGYLRPGKLAVLEPVRRHRTFSFTSPTDELKPAPSEDEELVRDAVAEYQTASYRFVHGLNHAPNAP